MKAPYSGRDTRLVTANPCTHVGRSKDLESTVGLPPLLDSVVHQTGVDAAGDLAGNIFPGSLGVLGLRYWL